MCNVMNNLCDKLLTPIQEQQKRELMTPRDFALQVTEQLQQAGYEALWAGGCVRDQLLGRPPKDYDVATSARPEQVRELFGKRRTLEIGASFGVITVLGPKKVDPIEVATFRKDSGYSDGRRPDSVEFTDAREDAIRRDFTINGMFFDPVAEKVHDFVGGMEDLDKKIIRAIGNPHERIDEDKLRMLRAVRFASTYEFAVDSETLAAVKQHADEIQLVSNERIGAELRRMLAHSNRAVAARLLRESELLKNVLPQGESLYENEHAWNTILKAMKNLNRNEFVCGAAIMLSRWLGTHSVANLADNWKISNDERDSISWILEHTGSVGAAHELPWSVVQPWLVHKDACRCIDVAEAILAALTGDISLAGIKFCRERLLWSQEKLNPEPLLDGNDLKNLNVPAGPLFGTILQTIRSEQLDGKLTTYDQAAVRAQEIANES